MLPRSLSKSKLVVERVWERKEEDGSHLYLTSWQGVVKKSWVPLETFATDEAKEHVEELEHILGDSNYQKPEWYIKHHSLKAQGVNMELHGINYTPKSAKRERSRSAGRSDKVKMRKIEDSDNEATRRLTSRMRRNYEYEDVEETDDTSVAAHTVTSRGRISTRPRRENSHENSEECDGRLSSVTASPVPGAIVHLNISDRILKPLLPAPFPVFDWISYIESTGGAPAHLECFWKRSLGGFVNKFENQIGKILKVPDFTGPRDPLWCTVGEVVQVYGPWVEIHILDTEPVFDEWFLSDDACLQPFLSMDEERAPRLKEPIKRYKQHRTNFRKIVDMAMEDKNGNDMRIAPEVGNKLETYDETQGEGDFYAATVIDVDLASEMIAIHFDGYPARGRAIKRVPFDYHRLFPCGFAAAIGWECVLSHDVKGPKVKSTDTAALNALTGPDTPGSRAFDGGQPMDTGDDNQNKTILRDLDDIRIAVENGVAAPPLFIELIMRKIKDWFAPLDQRVVEELHEINQYFANRTVLFHAHLIENYAFFPCR